MSGIQPDDKLALAVAPIARQLPTAWKSFMEAFAEFTEIRRNECINSNAEEVIKRQGRAQQCGELFTLFNTAIQTADRLAAKQQQMRTK